MSRIVLESDTGENLRYLIKLAIENEIKIIRHGLDRTRKKLKEFEDKYGMKSEEFYKRYNNGEMGDDMDYIKWAGEYETLQQLEKDYNELKGIELCS